MNVIASCLVEEGKGRGRIFQVVNTAETRGHQADGVC